MRRNMIPTVLGGTVAAALVLGALPAYAGGNGNGPQGSIGVVTNCELDAGQANFSVTLDVSDQSSGGATPIIASWSVTALAKTAKGNWKGGGKDGDQAVLGTQSADGLAVPAPHTFPPVNFLLCDGYDIDPDVAAAKALNASATVTLDDGRGVMNMCAADPLTGTGGISLTSADKDAIATFCASQ